MNRSRTISLIIGLLVVTGGRNLLVAQIDVSECRLLLQNALQLRTAPADSGCMLYREMRLTSCSISGDTTTIDAVSIEGHGLYIIRSDSNEVWQDSATMVILDHRHHHIRSVDLRGRGGVFAARQLYQQAFFDSLGSHLVDLDCTKVDTILRVSGRVIPEREFFYKAKEVTVDIRSDGEIVRYVTYHPNGSRFRTTEYVVKEIRRDYREIDPDSSVKEHFFENDATLRSAYRDYRSNIVN